jgi:diguanylate cyclase (GGDEF)-like protein/putative nucleotidyltransferase with HDIG domain
MLATAYWWLVVLAAMAASWLAIRPPAEAGAAGFVLYCLLACVTAPLKVKLPGVDRSVSLAYAFGFAALTELPPRYGLFVVLLALLYEDLLDARHTPPWREIAFQVAATALAAVGATAVHRGLREQLEVASTLALFSAAAAYYLSQSGLRAVAIGLSSGEPPGQVWREKFFWMAPLYLLAPVGIEATRSLWKASTAERLVGLGVILAGYTFVKRYFARLHGEQDHAAQLDAIRERTIESLAAAMEAKDGCTAGHLRRVKRHAVRLARKLRLPEQDLRTLELAAILHDVGKVGVPDRILGKPGRLTEEEFSELTVHSSLGAEIISAVQFPYPVEEVVLSHHEHWDGSGYPRSLVGEQIPLLARILSVADCFDALISDRPYRPALPLQEGVRILREQRGKLFDPVILDLFLESLPEFSRELERELEKERAELRVAREPDRRRQTWLAEERRSAPPEQLVAMYELLETLGADLPVQALTRQVLRQLEPVAPYDRAGVFLLDGSQYVLLQGERIPGYCVSRLALPASDGLLAQAAAAGRAIRASARLDDTAGPLAILFLSRMRSALAAPLTAHGRVAGAVALWSAVPGAFTEDQERFLGLLTRKLTSVVVEGGTLQKLWLEASTDPLTGLANARAAFLRLDQELETASLEDRSLAVLFLGMEGVDAVADPLLLAAARALRPYLRGPDFLARIGDAEFLAILPGLHPENLERKVQRLRWALEECGWAAPTIGVACFPQDGCSSQELVYLSDQRRYAGSGTPFDRIARSGVPCCSAHP